MSRPKVYLAGPITGCTFKGCTDWRKQVKDALDAAGIDGFSPMRGKDYLAQESVIHHDYPKEVLSCQRGIMTRDYNDCMRADAVLAYFTGATIVSVGTCMEVAWAYQRQIPVIVVMEPEGNPHDHPMMREAFGFRVTNLDDAIHTLKIVLLP